MEYQKARFRDDLLKELTRIENKQVTFLKLKDGDAPYIPSRCLLITDDNKFQIIIDSLKGVGSRYYEPFKNPIDFKFQLEIGYADGSSTDLVGLVYETYPDDAYIERNIWVKEGEERYSFRGQRSLYWPGIAPWLGARIKEADHTCTMKTHEGVSNKHGQPFKYPTDFLSSLK